MPESYEHILRRLTAGDQLGGLALREVLPFPVDKEQQGTYTPEITPSFSSLVDEAALRHAEETAMQTKNSAREAVRRSGADVPDDNPELLADYVELIAISHAIYREYDPMRSIAIAEELEHAARSLDACADYGLAA